MTPALATERLILDAFTPADGPRVEQLAGEWDVARMTLAIPHPYPAGAAEAWIATHSVILEKKVGVVFAIRLRDRSLIGCVGLTLGQPDPVAELGYWLGRPYWGQGYMTEAARACVDYGFRSLQLRRIHARCFAVNPRSARVLEKAGLRREGLLRQHLTRFNVVHDVMLFGRLRHDPA